MEQIDDLQLNHLQIIQDNEKFMFGTDGVLLARFAKVHKGDHVLDIGSGTGIASLICYGLQPAAEYTGIDIQGDMVELAERSRKLNGIATMQFTQADLKTYDGKHAFDVVLCNPPYEKDGTGKQCKNPAEAIARYEIETTFDDIAQCAFRALQPAGRFYLIHKAERVSEIARLLHENGLELKTIRPVQKNSKSAPRLLLLSAVSGGKEYVHWLPPLVLYDEDGNLKDYKEMGL